MNLSFEARAPNGFARKNRARAPDFRGRACPSPGRMSFAISAISRSVRAIATGAELRSLDVAPGRERHLDDRGQRQTAAPPASRPAAGPAARRRTPSATGTASPAPPSARARPGTAWPRTACRRRAPAGSATRGWRTRARGSGGPRCAGCRSRAAPPARRARPRRRARRAPPSSRGSSPGGVDSRRPDKPTISAPAASAPRIPCAHRLGLAPVGVELTARGSARGARPPRRQPVAGRVRRTVVRRTAARRRGGRRGTRAAVPRPGARPRCNRGRPP